MEFKRFICKRNMVVIAVILIISLIGVHKGSEDYNRVLTDVKEFIDVEDSSFKYIRNYVVYSKNGFKVNFVPSPNMALFTNPSIMTEISARINSVIKLNIYNDSKKNLIIDGGFPYRLKFSDITLLFFGLAALFFGFDAFRNKEYLKFLASRWSSTAVYISIVTARIFLLLLSFLFIFGVMLLFMLMKGIELRVVDFTGLSGYFLSALLLLLFYFITGTLLGPIRTKGIGLTVLFIVWIVSIIFIPLGLNYLANSKSANMSSPYKLDSDKLQVVSSFENHTEDKYGKFDKDNMERERKIVEEYFNHQYTRMETLEDQFKGKLEEQVLFYNSLSVLTPITFHNLTASEVSSRGYGNYFAFYGYLQELRRRFLRFWIDRVYYHDPQEMVNFVIKDENLFQGRSRLPDNFAAGIAVSMGYIIILLIASYIRFKNSLYTLSDTGPFTEKDMNRALWHNKVNAIYTGKRPGIGELLYNYFSGRYDPGHIQGPPLTVAIDGDEPGEIHAHERFVYICHPAEIPGEITAQNFLNYIARTGGLDLADKERLYRVETLQKLKRKTFREMTEIERAEVVITAIEYLKGDVFLVDRTCKDLDFKRLGKLKDVFDTQILNKVLIIYLSPEEEVRYKKTDLSKDCSDVYEWSNLVDRCRKLQEEEDEV
jgi:hypothetical protein